MQIGNTIKKIRKKKNISQKELAIKSNVSNTYLSQIENGKRPASIETLERISMSLDIPFPILSFLSLDVNSINPVKREAYIKIEPAIKALIQEFFVSE